MEANEFTGHISMMRADSEFLGVEDIAGLGDVPLIIEKCVQYKGRKACGKMQAVMYCLRLISQKGNVKKELWLKATNRRKLFDLYGADVSQWKGKPVWLFIEPCKHPQGGETLGIRIRDRKDYPAWYQQKQQSQPQQQPQPDSDGDMGARE